MPYLLLEMRRENGRLGLPGRPLPRRPLLLGDRARRGLGLDRDRPRLLLLGQLALQVDGEQAVLQLGAGHADVVGQLEAALEVARADAAIEVLGALVAVGMALAGHQELVLLLGDVELGL